MVLREGRGGERIRIQVEVSKEDVLYSILFFIPFFKKRAILKKKKSANAYVGFKTPNESI